MSRVVRAALVQAHANLPKDEALAKHVEMIEQAASEGAQITCLQEIFFGPYFCAQQEPHWFETAEPDDGPTVQAMRELAYPVFDTRVGKVGVFICYDRHFPEPARMLGLHGAQLTFNPSATIESLSRYLWELEQPAHAVANGYFVGAINRVGEELVPGARFYGSSYFCDPRGQIVAQASDSEDEVLVADLDLAMIDEVRTTWQFFRDRRPETYHELAQLLP